MCQCDRVDVTVFSTENQTFIIWVRDFANLSKGPNRPATTIACRGVSVTGTGTSKEVADGGCAQVLALMGARDGTGAWGVGVEA